MTKKPQRDVAQEITNQIIAALENGAANGGDWLKPWRAQIAAGWPQNATTGAVYRGSNIASLWAGGSAHGYGSNLWAGFKQWKAKGANVRKGEKGNIVVFYKPIVREEVTDTGETETSVFRMLKYSLVWNAEQVDGFDIPHREEREPLAARLHHVDEFVSNTRATVRDNQNQAYYSPNLDYIGMPAIGDFIDTDNATATEGYYGTFLHELTHWTRHESRLDRSFGRKRFGDEGYAMEELVAELGSAFACSALGIEATPAANHGHYIANWLRVLKNDKRAVLTASARAAEAFEYLESLQPGAAAAAAA